MNSKLFLPLFLCVAMLLPSAAAAQFFAKHKVVVWEIADRNNDVKVSDAAKKSIRTSMVDAFVGSRHYEAFEVNAAEVLNRVRATGQPLSPANIIKAIQQKSPVDYVLFTTMKVVAHANSYDNYRILLSSDLVSTATQRNERTAYVEMQSDINAIPAACAKLLSDLLGEQIAPARPAQQTTAQPQPSYQQSYQQPAYQPRPAGKKVGDLVYHNGASGIVVALYDDAGEHGLLMSVEETQCNWSSAKTWCANLGSGWKLPSKSQLQLISRSKDKLNAALAAKGFGTLANNEYAEYWLPDEYDSRGWSSAESDSHRAWAARIASGYAYGRYKSDILYVRAVSAF